MMHLVASSSLGLSSTSTKDLLASVLLLGSLGLGDLLNLSSQTVSDKSVSGLELLQGLLGVVDETETSGLSATKLGSKTKDGDSVLLGLVKSTNLLSELVLGDVGSVGVKDINNKLSSSKKRVSNELSSSNGNSVRHVVCDVVEGWLV